MMPNTICKPNNVGKQKDKERRQRREIHHNASTKSISLFHGMRYLNLSTKYQV